MKDAQGHGSDSRGGPAGRFSRGNVTPQRAADSMHGGHVVSGTHDSTYHAVGRNGYNPQGVQRSIDNARARYGRNYISGKEAGMIHALLRGRG